MSLGEKLKRARQIKGYTQEQVAERLNIDKSTYCGYETGKRAPDVRKIRRLADVLDVSADELLELTDFGRQEGDVSLSQLQPDIRMIARAGRKMSPEQAAMLRKYAEFMFPEAFSDD